PVDTIGDVYSLANCNEIGCRRLVEMMDEFELDDLDALGEHICRHSERAVREEIARLPKGSWRYEMTLDGYDEPITLVATTTVSDTGIHVDYTGTSCVARRGINVPLRFAPAFAVFRLRVRRGAGGPEHAGAALPPHGHRPRRVNPKRAIPPAGALPPRDRTDAAGHGLWLLAPGCARACARRRH